MAPWWLTVQLVPVAASLALVGYALHDALQGRLKGAPQVAVSWILALTLLGIVLNAEVSYAALALAAMVPLGASLSQKKDDIVGVPRWPAVTAGISYAIFAAVVAQGWAERFYLIGGVAMLVLLSVRASLEPLAAWWSTRGSTKGAGVSGDIRRILK